MCVLLIALMQWRTISVTTSEFSQVSCIGSRLLFFFALLLPSPPPKLLGPIHPGLKKVWATLLIVSQMQVSFSVVWAPWYQTNQVHIQFLGRGGVELLIEMMIMIMIIMIRWTNAFCSLHGVLLWGHRASILAAPCILHHRGHCHCGIFHCFHQPQSSQCSSSHSGWWIAKMK